MSKGNELYVRRSKSSDPIMMSDTEDQMWDDSSMTAAYDKAVSKANAEIAKQIAMETNSSSKHNAKPNEKKDNACAKSPKNSPKIQNPRPQIPAQRVWTEGMPCRATFYEDDQEYEAVVYAILDDVECVVKFLGYENSEIVDIDSLKESLGDEPRMRQIEQATGSKFDDGFESLSNEDTSNVSAPPPGNQQKKKEAKKKPQKPQPNQCPNVHVLPDFFLIGGPGLPQRLVPTNIQLPNSQVPNLKLLNSQVPHFQLPNFQLPNFQLPNMPVPPPPPTAANNSEEQALSSMLISWYMSGYHTGLYQGLKKSKESRRN